MHGPSLEADVVWQRAAVDEHAAELVHAALPCLDVWKTSVIFMQIDVVG